MPSLVPYKDLMKFISQQEIGTLHHIPQVRADSEIEKESEDVNQNLLPLVPGHFISLEERLLQMADLYLHIDGHRPNFLNWFGKEKGNFLVAIGADGAPQTLSRFARHFPASSTSFARKYCSNRSTYWVHYSSASLNLPIFP